MNNRAGKDKTIARKMKTAILCAAALCITVCLSFVCLETRAYFHQSREYTAGTVAVGSFTETETDSSPALLTGPKAKSALSSETDEEGEDTPLRAVSIEKEAKVNESDDYDDNDRTDASSDDKKTATEKTDTDAKTGTNTEKDTDTNTKTDTDTDSDSDTSDDTAQENTDRIEVDSWVE